MKKIINDPEHVVSEMLAGIEISDSSLKYIPGFEVIARREPNKEKVAIISGGGSGHEPAHAGYVGLGMLDAAVAGNVFASPSPDRILEAIHQVGSGDTPREIQAEIYVHQTFPLCLAVVPQVNHLLSAMPIYIVLPVLLHDQPRVDHT